MTPEERFSESMKLWDTYLALGGSLEPEPDTQSPFFNEQEWRENFDAAEADRQEQIRLKCVSDWEQTVRARVRSKARLNL
jgi:hypothetical protein